MAKSTSKTSTQSSKSNYPYIETDKEQQSTSLPVARREYVLAQEATTVKCDKLFIYNDKFRRWHECSAILRPPNLIVTEHHDMSIDVNERQLLHLQQNWYHGSLSRREAKCILQDHGGGNGSFLVRTSESYHGKFAISFMHESRVKHVVVESKRDPVARVMYHITPNGPYFDSLYALIQEAHTTAIIQNHAFDLVLGSSPVKSDNSWLHRGTLSASQAHQIMRNEQREGAFFVHKTLSVIVPYVLLLRSGGTVHEHLIVSTQRPAPAFTLNGITAPVLYKLVHYFMENPIMDSTVLKYPVPDPDSVCSNNAITLKSYTGQSSELTFGVGSLITDVWQKTKDWSIGSYRGDKNKWFPSNCVRFLTQDELLYVKEVHSDQEEQQLFSDVHIVDFSRQNFVISVTTSSNSDPEQLRIKSHDTKPGALGHDYLLSAPTAEDLRQWYRALQEARLLESSVVSTNKRDQLGSIGKERPSDCSVS